MVCLIPRLLCDHVLQTMVPLIYNSQDKGEATELMNNIFGKDTIVDIESTIKPSQMIKASSSSAITRHSTSYPGDMS